jgi:beta-galactosidase/beta-glucuronidase
MKSLSGFLNIQIMTVSIVIIVILTGCQISGKHDLKSEAGKDKSVRKTVTLSTNWRFQLDIKDIGEKEGWFKDDFDRNSWAKVTVPEAWDCYETALWGYEGIGWYTSRINPENFKPGNRTEIVFNRVMFYSKVWLNGEYIGENIGGYLPFSFDITKFLKPGKENTIVIRVDNKPRIEWLPAGKQIEWIQYGGILQPVQLIGTSHTYIDNFTIRTEPEKSGARISCIVDIANETGSEAEMDIKIEIARETSIIDKSVKIRCKPNDSTKVSVEISLNKADLWSPESPALYTAKVSLKNNETILDDITQRFGIRKVSTSGNSILLNGKPIIIKGVNRYDEYDRMGPVVSEETLRRELELMKSIGINTIRVHYPQSPVLISLYDEYGFMMMEEVPLNWWGRTNWGKVKMSLDILDFAKPALRKMIARDKNHPSIIIWSMGNENETDKEPGITVMRELIRLAKDLDSTRLITYTVSYDPRKHLAFDETDIVCFNKYNGLDESSHIAQIDSFGYKSTVKELAELRSFYSNKPLLFTEFGCQSIKNIHGDVYYSEEFQAAYIERIWDAIKGNRGISGGILWCWADYYHRKYFINYAVYGPYGVVTIDRQPKKALEALARMYGGSLIKK